MADQAVKPKNNDPKERKYRSYSYNERLDVIMMSDSGMSSPEIASITGINDSLIRYWVRRYRKNGLEGLRRKRYTPQSTALSGNQDTKGFVRYIDNPEILNAQVEKLRSCGIIDDNIVVGTSASSLFNELNFGLTVVLNSFFDLASDLPGIIRLLSFALKKGITVVSLNDGRLEVSSKDKGIMEILERYAYTDMRRINYDFKKKKNYSGLSLNASLAEPESCILAGSQTDVTLEVNDVTVEEYTAGFDEDGNDFKTINFD